MTSMRKNMRFISRRTLFVSKGEIYSEKWSLFTTQQDVTWLMIYDIVKAAHIWLTVSILVVAFKLRCKVDREFHLDI